MELTLFERISMGFEVNPDDGMSFVLEGVRQGIIKGALDRTLFKENSYGIKEFLELSLREALLEEMATSIRKDWTSFDTTNSCGVRRGPQVDVIRQTKRENAMSRFANIIAVATSINDGDNAIGNLTGPLAEAMETHKVEQQKAAATELVGMLRSVESSKNAHRQSLRQYRRAMQAQQKNLEAIDRAMAYGNETNNFVPLLVAIGEVSSRYDIQVEQDEFSRLQTIPANWTPTVAEPPLATES